MLTFDSFVFVFFFFHPLFRRLGGGQHRLDVGQCAQFRASGQFGIGLNGQFRDDGDCEDADLPLFRRVCHLKEPHTNFMAQWGFALVCNPHMKQDYKLEKVTVLVRFL
jgi:hypothetical protein